MENCLSVENLSEPAALNGDIIVPDESSGNILVRLNYDCLLQIFECLPLRDLCAVAGVCKIFEWNAVSVFKRHHVDIDLDTLLDEGESEDLDTSNASEHSWNSENSEYDEREHVRLLPMDRVISLFRHFGAYIRTIRIDVEDEDQEVEVLKLLSTYCAGEDADLNKLILTDTTISADLMPQLQSLFDRLKCLEVTNSSFHIGSDLTELYLEDVDLDTDLTQKLEKLQCLTLFNVCETWSGALVSLLALTVQLKRLHISHGKLPTLLKDLNFYTPELEELEIDLLLNYEDVQQDLNNVARLKHLKVFSCKLGKLNNYCTMEEVLHKFVEQNLQIEELSLSKLIIVPNAATNLAKLSKVKKLTFSDGGWMNPNRLPTIVKGMPFLEQLSLCNFGEVTVGDVKAIIVNAPKLNEFQINLYQEGLMQDIKEFVIHTHDFIEIRDLIAKRLGGTKLCLDITGARCKLDVSQYIIEKNCKWLEVTIITYEKNELMNMIDYYGFSDDSDESESSDESEFSDESESSDDSN